MLISLLLACIDPSDASHAAAAERGVDLRAAEQHCRAMSDRAEADACRVRAMDRFRTFDCDRVQASPWLEECRFLHAEQTARRHGVGAAAPLCRGTAWAARCAQHVLNLVAAAKVTDTPAAALAAWTEASALFGPDTSTEFDFWRTWHRMRLEAGLPLLPDACPDPSCRAGARAEMRLVARASVRANGCDAPLDAYESEDVRRWVEDFRREMCAGRPPRPR